jgi:hypothetical protein
MEVNKYERLKDYLNHHDDLNCYPSEVELEDIFHIVLQQQAWSDNVGYKVERIKESPIEKAFHETWLKWNEPKAGVNSGNGILQDLFIERGLNMWDRKWIAEISPRERWIVATIIQWLGTNVGMSFLHEVFREVNMHIAQSNPR